MDTNKAYNTIRDYWQAVEAEWSPTLATLKAAGIGASLEYLGGGHVVHVPLSEDGTHYVYLGTDADGSDPMYVGTAGVEAVLGGCVYRHGPDTDGYGDLSHRYAMLTDRRHGGDIVGTVRAMLTEAMAVPAEAYELH